MKNNNPVTEYDKSQIFKEEIKPILLELKKKCRVNNIPFFFSCAAANTDKKTSYTNEGVLTGSLGIDLTDDKFEKFVMVLRGAELQPLGAISQFDDDAMRYIMDGAEEAEPDEVEYLDNGSRFIGDI